MLNPNITDPYRSIKILILEDIPEDAELMRHELEKAGYIIKAKIVDDEQNFVLSLEHFFPDIILADYSLPSFSGFDALLISKEKRPDTPFVFVTGAIGEEIAAETIVSGASGFVLKSNMSKLPEVVGNIFKNQGGWRNHRLEHTSKRIRSRIEANLEALDRIYEFLEKSKNTEPGWKDAMNEVEQLREDLSNKNNASQEDKDL